MRESGRSSENAQVSCKIQESYGISDIASNFQSPLTWLSALSNVPSYMYVTQSTVIKFKSFKQATNTTSSSPTCMVYIVCGSNAIMQGQGFCRHIKEAIFGLYLVFELQPNMGLMQANPGKR